MIASFSQNFSGTVDNNGNVNIPISGLFANKWAMVMATAQQVLNTNGKLIPVGRPTWNLQIAQDVLDIQSGTSVNLGPRPVMPGATITITLFNGIPGAFVNGVLHGTYGPNASELLTASYIPQSNQPSLTTTEPGPDFVAQETLLSGSGTTLRTYSLPYGDKALILTLSPSQSQPTIQYSVVGAASNIPYYSTPGTASDAGRLPIIVPIFDPRDWVPNGINVTYSLGGLGTSQTVIVTARSFDVQSAYDRFWSQPQTGIGNGVANIASAGDMTMIGAPASQFTITYLFDIQFDIIGVASTFVDLQDTSGASLGWRLDTSFTRSVSKQFYGRSIGPLGVKLHNSSPNATGAINFGIGYTQQ